MLSAGFSQASGAAEDSGALRCARVVAWMTTQYQEERTHQLVALHLDADMRRLRADFFQARPEAVDEEPLRLHHSAVHDYGRSTRTLMMRRARHGGVMAPATCMVVPETTAWPLDLDAHSFAFLGRRQLDPQMVATEFTHALDSSQKFNAEELIVTEAWRVDGPRGGGTSDASQPRSEGDGSPDTGTILYLGVLNRGPPGNNLDHDDVLAGGPPPSPSLLDILDRAVLLEVRGQRTNYTVLYSTRSCKDLTASGKAGTGEHPMAWLFPDVEGDFAISQPAQENRGSPSSAESQVKPRHRIQCQHIADIDLRALMPAASGAFEAA